MMDAAINRLFLSRILLNPLSRQGMTEITQPYEMHRTIMRAFPETGIQSKSRAREDFGVLFRVEIESINGLPQVYVQSHVEPDWSYLTSYRDYLRQNSPMPAYACKDIMPFYRKIRKGQVLTFRLRANPTKRIAKQDDSMKGKRVELSREEDQICWLHRKGKEREKGVPGGFELVMDNLRGTQNQHVRLPHVNVADEGKLEGRKRKPGTGHTTTHLSVLYDGLLRVTDADAFLNTLIHGIGPAKAYGFGLISVAPIIPSDKETH